MTVKIKIMSKDSKNVAKIVIFDESNKILFLKRSNYVKKFAGELDLPGGHIKVGESVMSGLMREVMEETSLNVLKPELLKRVGTTYYFCGNYENQPIELSDEHTDYVFLDESELNIDEKYQKIALEALEKRKNELS